MAFDKKTIRDVPISGKVVLVRTDYNVPLKRDGTIANDFRIRASLPTLQHLLSQNCKIVIISHLGRPAGRQSIYSLGPVAKRLAGLLGRPVRFVDQTVGDKVKLAVQQAKPQSLILLENLRFHSEEKADSFEFAKKIIQSTGAQYFVQDGFGVSHRAHASTHAVTMYLPSVAGLLIEKEYKAITDVITAPDRPLVVVVGGCKVSDKVAAIERFIDIADKIIIGGAMANTFWAYHGRQTGKSLVESGQSDMLDKIYAAARRKVGQAVDDFIILPTDFAIGGIDNPETTRTIRQLDEIGASDTALDIGEASIKRLVAEVRPASSVIWNGTLGCAEIPVFAHGSSRLAAELAARSDITSIIGGGDTTNFVLDWDDKNGASFSHVSTGGGASLELIAGNNLPGIDSLLDKRL